MAKICVEIEMDSETGALIVYPCEPEAPEAIPPDAQSFQDVESALQAAGQMLTSQQGAGGMDEMKAAMQGGYDKVRPKPAAPPSAGAGMFGEE